nr:unnamed protein product [Digitaria exilis]
MVMRKRSGNGSRGRRIATTPRVPNSARGKRSTRKKKDDMRAFDLLATVAETLLDDQDNSANAPNASGAAKAKNKKAVKEEHYDEILPLKNMVTEKDSRSGCAVGSDGSKLNLCSKKIPATRQKMQRTIFKKKKLAHRATSFAKEMLNEVKLRIKSFNIPELFIDVPENATIGSLKRTVMDVVNSIIQGGLRVGVLLQGKDIQDDNKTLRQAGICHDKKLNNIDFTLECEGGQDSPSGIVIPEHMDLLGADVVEPLARVKCEEPFPETGGDDNQQRTPPYRSRSLSDLYSDVHPVEMASQDASASSQAIVPVAPSDDGALAIVPHCRPRRTEIGQRRTRTPFHVDEVEALVDAVELIGTGRWRAVKMHAFDHADHRTYVDLKDKWKTLVHTASIAPHQRRGEPVPQELLDRVLAAQAYWTEHQQDKPPRGKAALPAICPA